MAIDSILLLYFLEGFIKHPIMFLESIMLISLVLVMEFLSDLKLHFYYLQGCQSNILGNQNSDSWFLVNYFYFQDSMV